MGGGVLTKHLPLSTSKLPQHQFTGTHTRQTINILPPWGGRKQSLNGGPPAGHTDASKRALEYQSGGFDPGAEGCAPGEGDPSWPCGVTARGNLSAGLLRLATRTWIIYEGSTFGSIIHDSFVEPRVSHGRACGRQRERVVGFQLNKNTLHQYFLRYAKFSRTSMTQGRSCMRNWLLASSQ